MRPMGFCGGPRKSCKYYNDLWEGDPVERGVCFSIPVARWSAWPHPEGLNEDTVPEVRFVEPQLRRRLGPLARMMLHVAQQCAADARNLRLVFGSQHGELGYTVALLKALAAQEPLSPTVFSLSVHNAAAGMFSMLRAERTASTAIAAGDETLGQALVESYCQLDADPAQPVLMVYADGAFPPEYREFEERPQNARALAVLLSRDASRTASVEAGAGPDAPVSRQAQADSFVQHLAAGTPGSWTGERRTWTWH